MIVMYGISNCDTIKKARRWLESNHVAYEFHDYKKSGIDKVTLQDWCKKLGYDALLNTRGTTWRKLPESGKSAMTEAKAVDLMLAHNSIIRRPVLVSGKRILVGFDEASYKSLL